MHIYATQIVRKLTEAGYLAYFAGGWVRDFLMGIPSSDIDIATNATPQEIIQLFPKTIPVGISFGVVIVIIKGHQFEVSTFRQDGLYIDGRRPEHVELSDPREDAKRRDFTINGMFFDPLTETIIDYVDGQEDIKKGVVRTIGDPRERFKEDRLRMIRAVRFATRFQFTIDQATREAIQENAQFLLPAVSMERIWQELKKMAEGERLDIGLMEMEKLGLLAAIFPKLAGVASSEIQRCVDCYQKFPKNCPPILFISELFPNDSLAELEKLCDYLKVSNQERDMVAYVFQGRQLMRSEKNLPAWAHYLADSRSNVNFEVITAGYPSQKRDETLQTLKLLKEQLRPHIDRIINKTPLVNAKMLENQGIKPGKLMGDLLKEAERIAITNDINDPLAAMQILYKSPLWPIL